MPGTWIYSSRVRGLMPVVVRVTCVDVVTAGFGPQPPTRGSKSRANGKPTGEICVAVTYLVWLKSFRVVVV